MVSLVFKCWCCGIYIILFLVLLIALIAVIFSMSIKIPFVGKFKVIGKVKKTIIIPLLFSGIVFFGYIAIGSINFMAQLATFENEKMPS